MVIYEQEHPGLVPIKRWTSIAAAIAANKVAGH